MEKSPFDFEESLAVARLIWMLIYSDQQITHNESDYFQQSLDYLNLTYNEFDDYLQLPEEEPFSIVRGLSSKKRSLCAMLLRLAYNSDQNVDRIELSKLNDILIRAELFRSDNNKRKQDDDIII